MGYACFAGLLHGKSHVICNTNRYLWFEGIEAQHNLQPLFHLVMLKVGPAGSEGTQYCG